MFRSVGGGVISVNVPCIACCCWAATCVSRFVATVRGCCIFDVACSIFGMCQVFCCALTVVIACVRVSCVKNRTSVTSVYV
jgi:hypothetical protein